MARNMPGKVPFTKSNVSGCKCPGCPVQSGSSCVAAQLVSLNESLAKNPLPPEQIPGLYCSTGKASCGDILTERGCLCGDCPVFFEYELKTRRPLNHYCKDGAAK